MNRCFVLGLYLALIVGETHVALCASNVHGLNRLPDGRSTVPTTAVTGVAGKLDGRAMLPPDILTIRQYGAKSVSPDGSMIALEIVAWAQSARRESGDTAGQLNHRTVLWLVSRENGKRIRLTPPSPIRISQWNPVWSPDSKHLAFLSTENKENIFLRVWDRPTGSTRLLSRSSIDFNSEMNWIDNSHILAMFLPSGVHSHSVDEDSRSLRLANHGLNEAAEGKEPTAVAAVSPPDPQEESHLHVARLEIVNTATGTSRTVGELPVWQSRMAERSVIVSPNRKWAALNVWVPPAAMEADVQFTPREMEWTRFGVVSLANQGEKSGVHWIRDLQPAIYLSHGSSSISWNPESSKIALLAQRPASRSPVYAVQVDAATGVANAIPQLNEEGLNRDGNEREPDRIVWLQDGRLAVEMHAQKSHDRATPDDKWWVFDGERLIPLPRSDEAMKPADSPQRTNSFKLHTSSTGRLYETVADGRKKTLFPDLNPGLADIAEPRWVHFQYRGVNDEDLHASLLLPNGYKPGASYPTVVWVYSGDVQTDNDEPVNRDDDSFLNLLVLAGHGYAVLFPSMPLSSEGVPDDPMTHLNDGVDPAIDKAVALGIADPNRLAVMGHSYGGYSTFGLITETHRYRAAIGMMGISDLVSMYGEFDSRFRYDDPDYAAELGPYFDEWAQGGMGAPPWADPERYVRNSPVFYANRITAPLLIIAGDLDSLDTQSEEMYTALQRQGKRAEFVRYLGEEHVLKSPANILDMWQRIFDWLDTYVKNVPAEIRSK
jgi:dipeptidyl aminopeptidase/acylaminoacyl peptidase